MSPGRCLRIWALPDHAILRLETEAAGDAHATGRADDSRTELQAGLAATEFDEDDAKQHRMKSPGCSLTIASCHAARTMGRRCFRPGPCCGNSDGQERRTDHDYSCRATPRRNTHGVRRKQCSSDRSADVLDDVNLISMQIDAQRVRAQCGRRRDTSPGDRRKGDVGAGGGIRTPTWSILSGLPLPIGLHQQTARPNSTRSTAGRQAYERSPFWEDPSRASRNASRTRSSRPGRF